MNSVFKVGDKVRIKYPHVIDDCRLIQSEVDPKMSNFFIQEMKPFIGEECKVTDCNALNGYRLNGGGYYHYLPEWLELIESA